MFHVLNIIGQRLADGRLHAIAGVSTSQRTAQIAEQFAIPLVSLIEHPELDLAIDGADEIDPELNLIKGRGGALLREKVVAAAARELLIVTDHTKLVSQLGNRTALPIEVIPFAAPLVIRWLNSLGGTPRVRYIAAEQPFYTDENNIIIDYSCGLITDPITLTQTLCTIPGIVDHGLFLSMAHRAIIADSTGFQVMESFHA